MAMTPQLFSLSGAATELGMDRRTIAAALADTPPDGELRGHPAWKLRSILAAVNNGTSAAPASNSDLAESERLTKVLTQGLTRIEAESCIAKRRKLFKQLAPNFGKLDGCFTRMNEGLPEHEKDLLVNYQQMAMGGLLSRLLSLCQIQIKD